MAAVSSLAEVNDSANISSPTVNGKAEAIIKSWGFPLDELFKLALKFYKEKVGTKALEITYEDKLKLVALSKQALFGKYKVEANSQVGFLDVIGNDRRQAWESLGNMTEQTAMLEFVKTLNRLSPLLKPFVQAYKMEKEETERRQLEQEKKAAQEAEERERQARVDAARRQQEMERERQLQQEMEFRTALNQQTINQFRQYAQQQFPNMADKQEALIQQLQDQHYKQYMEQVYQQHMLQQQQHLLLAQQLQQQSLSSTSSPSSSPTKLQQPDDSAESSPVHAAVNGSGNARTGSESSAGGAADRGTTSSKKKVTLNGGVPNGGQHLNGHTHNVNAGVDTGVEAAEGGEEDDDSDTENGGLPTIAAPSMWTRKDIKEFKAVLSSDPDSVVKVGSGETVTVRVPTHEDGSCLFWEFATDSYDVGFGVFFEWSPAHTSQVSVHVCESSDDEEEAAAAEHRGEEPSRKEKDHPPTDEIVAVYRRDSHQEVYCGSHAYPGRGVYLLKFDNSYSLWRAKTLYYRVYYTR